MTEPEPLSAISAAEGSLRSLVAATLEPLFGPQWFETDSGLTDDRLAQIREWQTTDSKNRKGVVPTDDLLSFSTFPDLKKIIHRHWEHFPVLQDQKTFDVYIEHLNTLRNAVMHGRELVHYERQLVLGISGELRNRVTRFMSTKGPHDEYFARIESVRDSFGNVVTPKERICHTDLELRPGDEVTFECRGWDPQGNELNWYWSVMGRGNVPVEGNTFTWNVYDIEVAAIQHVFVQLVGGGAYHRYQTHDGKVTFTYAVLPPAS